MQDIEFPGIQFYPRTQKQKTNFNVILNTLKFATVEKGYEVFIGIDVADKIGSMFTETQYMDKSSLWSAWDKFGIATKTHIYKNSEGKIEVHL